ncbi:uncharacterized protein LOC113214754 [Frankliniella occidentalis]|uniref:Uncharacterized protein LOC113214754 n=1 Tax=Frankliniella occidentalis TaxID=133901 RepID=A0A6J1TB07_FRAOC|nr:uncharacterized protein LOC113214754 [Frankliniella occidentalis]
MACEMNVEDVSQTGPTARQQEKEARLAEAPGVTRLVKVWCHEDPAWSLQLLRCAAPSLELLSVYFALEDHLREVHDAMPRLRRLELSGGYALLHAQPPELPTLPPGRDGLQWLSVGTLPRATTQSLLKAHAGTLEELQLYVGTPGIKEWPDTCGDLHSLLQQSGLQALRRLVLRRWGCSHKPVTCSEQRAEVRRVLPGAEVLCSECDPVELAEV